MKTGDNRRKERVTVVGPDHISPSQISMYLRCARQWEYRYVEGIIAPPSISLIVGAAYHDALAVNFMQKIASQQDLPVGDVLDAFSTSWDRQLTRRVTVEDDEQKEFDNVDYQEEDPRVAKDVGISLVDTYHRTVAPKIQPISVERSCEVEIAGMKLVGRLDLEEDTGKIDDHKTSSKSKTQDEIDRELQPSAYGLLVMHPVDFGFHVAVKKRNPEIQILNTHRTAADIVWFLRLAQQVWALMQTGVYPPNPTGWWCSEKYCGYWNMCRGGHRANIG